MKANYISDNLHGTIRISNCEKELISTTAFNRLHYIHQNSTVYLTFPTCKTKRFEHSIGTMHLAGRMFYNSICNSDKNTIEKLMSLFSGEFKEYDFSSSKLFNDDFYNYNMPFNLDNEHKKIYTILYQSIRLTALFHDIGHPPYSHVVEKAIFYIIKNAELREENSFSRLIADLREYFQNNNDKSIHEPIGNFITKIVMSKDNANDVFQKVVFECTQKILNSSHADKDLRYFSLHGFTSGSLDADRLDYISRDRISSGLDNGRLNYDRLLSDLKIIFSSECNELFFICLNIKMKDIVDDVFIKRFNIYSYMNYHHRSLKMASILEKVIIELAQEELINQTIDIPDKGVLQTNISGLWDVLKFLTMHSITKDDKEKFLNLLIQWDDNYLMTVLKKYLYRKEYKNVKVKKLLEELVSNKKVHYSLIKREEDFSEVNKGFQEYLENKQDYIIELINDLDNIVIKAEQLLGNVYTNRESKIKINNFIRSKEVLKNRLTSFNKISEHISIFIEDSTLYYDKVKFGKTIEKVLSDTDDSLSFSVEIIEYSLGKTKTPVYLYNNSHSGKDSKSNLYFYDKDRS